MSALLEVQGLSVRYGEAEALDGVCLHLFEGELVSVLGANGAGKTTLVRSIAGMLPVAAGRIRFDGRDITHLASDEVCELGIGQVPEGRQIFPGLSVYENLLLGGDLRRARRHRRRNLERVFALFPRLAERRRQAAGTLSGGEQQMLAIGRCLMAEPRLLLFDEPSLGLAPLLVEEVFAVMRQLRTEGRTILLVEQNLAQSLALCERAYVLENGRILLEGSAAAIAGNDHIRRAYLGL